MGIKCELFHALVTVFVFINKCTRVGCNPVLINASVLRCLKSSESRVFNMLTYVFHALGYVRARVISKLV